MAQGNPYVWEGPVRPTDLSATYTLRVTLYARKRPVVDVLAPTLISRSGGEAIPHLFPSGSICLHINGGWDRSHYLHETILPWSSLWLYYYEMWHATGDWLGGGHEFKTDAVADAALNSNR